MTTQAYYDDPYRREDEAIVTAVLPEGLVLDSTIFYPEGGGQRGDRGLVDGHEVLDTKHIGQDIVHIMDDTSSFSVGQRVHLSLDWPARYRLMQAHTAQHMIAGLFHSMAGIGTVAIHLADDFLTVELDCAQLPLETIYSVEDRLNREILASRAVSACVVEHEEAEKLGLRRSIKVQGPVRLVTIEGVDIIACGGLHVASTDEIGTISYAGSEKLRGHVRTIWHYGENAVALRRSEHEMLARAGQVLSCPPLDVADAALALQQQVKGLSGELRAKDEMIASLLLEKGGGLIMSPVPTAAFQKLCREEGSFLVLHEEGGRTFWLLNGDEEQFRAFKEACASCGLKGGGRGRLYQGSAECTAKVLAGKAGSVVDG